MKKIVIMFVILILTVTLASCSTVPVSNSLPDNENVFTPDQSNESSDSFYDNTESANTVMDLFKGERRLWYSVDVSFLEPITYNTAINMVLVTENSQTIDFYYYATDMEIDQLVLSDLAGLDDDQILELVSTQYHSGSVEYYLTGFFSEPELLYNAISLPSEITYSGDLDKTGNHLVCESVTFYDPGVGSSSLGNGPWVEACHIFDFLGFNYLSDFPLTTMNKVEVVKDKEYLRFSELITLNNDPSFKTVVLDGIEGATYVQ